MPNMDELFDGVLCLSGGNAGLAGGGSRGPPLPGGLNIGLLLIKGFAPCMGNACLNMPAWCRAAAAAAKGNLPPLRKNCCWCCCCCWYRLPGKRSGGVEEGAIVVQM